MDDSSSDTFEVFVTKDRLFTATDAQEGNSKIHPVARLGFDAQPEEDKISYMKCPMKPQKQLAHLEFIKRRRSALEKNEVFDPELIASLAIVIPNATDKKKWRCGVAGCPYIGTKQHIMAHMRKKEGHLGLKSYRCSHENCQHVAIHQHDLKRHELRHNNTRIKKGSRERKATTKFSGSGRQVIKTINKATYADHSASSSFDDSNELRPTKEAALVSEASAATWSDFSPFPPVPSASVGMKIIEGTYAHYNPAEGPPFPVHQLNPYPTAPFATMLIPGTINEGLYQAPGHLNCRQPQFQHTLAAAPYPEQIVHFPFTQQGPPPPPPMPRVISAGTNHYGRYVPSTDSRGATCLHDVHSLPSTPGL
ncbi:hypothetical protein M408DRAFT_215478 [Serendipita vermifera MAFF 305830]|uniref:C2H2-type domain-containing protein n=1 Tax=Serendipita vermifera MAFF 305830 TaxID=933852 RepID=A0A0C3BL89_SERVB|nr:hypothetical protein M408DRAFT_215478 [Serendipita vermifera MAFF 305830]